MLGVIDPHGVSSEELERAAASMRYRGTPSVFRIDRGAVASFGRATVHRSVELVAVADGRIDDAALDEEGSPAAVLSRVLSASGPSGLNGVPADFGAGMFDRSGLTLVRDVAGMRPLFWGRRGRRFAFASDPAALIRLGIASGELDMEVIRASLFERESRGSGTAFAGVRRVQPGSWVHLDPDGRLSGGRWFRPEAIEPDRQMSLAEASLLARQTILAATASRAQGGRVALLLSGGRDSTSVAVALAELGIRALCFTMVLEAPGVDPEASTARSIALDLGHEWIDLHIPPRLDRERSAEIARLAGTPLGFSLPPIDLAIHDAVRSAGASVVLEGQGGEPLFGAWPLSVLDLALRGRFATAIRAAQGFKTRWKYGYRFTLKEMGRSCLPTSLLQMRERLRGRPPWVIPPHHPAVRAPKTERRRLFDQLTDRDHELELGERLYAFAGATYACPLLDLRVIELALRLPLDLRLPLVTPKPVLARAFLGPWLGQLVKARQTGFFMELHRSTIEDFPGVFGYGSLAARRNVVRPDGLAAARDVRWGIDALALIPIESWLEMEEDRR